jgi:hypothetical protein
MTKKHLIIASIIVGASTLSIAGLASAATAKPDSLAAEIAQKFHLKESDVQSVIDTHRGEMQSYRESHYEDRLAQAVKDGKLTAAQKDQILAKRKELQDFAATLKDKSPADRRTAMQQKLDETRAWEKSNMIPAGYLGGLGNGFGHHFGAGHGGAGHSSEGADPGSDGGQG